MNYFDSNTISNELWFHIFDFIEDERTLGRLACVCKHWREVTYDSHCKTWLHVYGRIWQEIPFVGPGHPFAIARQAFLHRFTFTHLAKVGRALGGAIPSVAYSILAIRQAPVKEDPPLTSLGQYHSSQFWHQKFSHAYQTGDGLGQMYAGKEIQLLFKARNQERELLELRLGCLRRLTDPEVVESEKMFEYALFQNLFFSIEEFKAFVLQYPGAYDLLYNSAKHGFNNLIAVYLEANSEELIREAPLFLAEAAENHQFGTMQLMLAHRPALPCLTPGDVYQETALHNLCTLLEEEVVEEDFVTWQALVQELVSRGCHPLKRDEAGLTSFHRTIQKSNSKFLNWLIETYEPCSPELFQELRDYLFDYVDSRADHPISDTEFEDEAHVLRILFDHHPPLRNGFDLPHDLCWYPWILQVFVELTDLHRQQHNLQILFTHLLSTPNLFIQDLLANYNVRDYPFLQSEVVDYLAIFERQVHRLIEGGLSLDYIHPEGETLIHILIFSLRRIEKTMVRKWKNKAMVQKLFSKCQGTYQAILQAIITQRNSKSPNPSIPQPMDLAKNYQYDELQGILMLFELNVSQPNRPTSAKKRLKIEPDKTQ